MAQISETVDYTKKAFLHSSYRWVKLTPVGGSGQTATLSLSSSTIVNFEIPNNVMNLSISKLCYDLLLPVSGATTSQNIDALSLSMFDRITLSTRSGVVLANCDNMGQFTHIISKLKTKAVNLVDNANNITVTPQVVAGGPSVPLTSYPLPSPLNSSQAISSKKPYTDICKSGSCPSSASYRSLSTTTAGAVDLRLQVISNNVSSNYRIDGSLISTPFLENLHVITENKLIAQSVGLATSYQLPLGSIKDTLLEINKSIYFGDNLILSLSFNPLTKFTWYSTAGVDGSGASCASIAAATTAFTQVAGSVPVQWSPTIGAVPATVGPATNHLTNLTLYVAVETDPVISSQLINRVNTEGFTMTVPFVYCTKSPVTLAAPLAQNGTAGTSSFSMQQRITRGYGQRLLRCYSAIFGSETVAANNQCYIEGGAAILPRTIGDGSTVRGIATTGFTINQHSDVHLGGYNTSLDGVRLQDFTLSAEDSTHWLVNEPYLRGSCILNCEQYKNQCMHIDSWTGRPVCEEDDTVDNGLSLDADKTYGVTYNTLYNISNVTTYQHYLFFVVQRQLSIRGNQIGLM